MRHIEKRTANLFMAAIAKRCIARGFACAEELAAIFLSSPFHGCKLTPLVAAIAKRLIGRLPARAPKIRFSRFHLNGNWRITCAFWI
jgi:hypothetical protein